MKNSTKYIVLSIFLLCSSCVVNVTGPKTGTEYTMGIEEERGIFLEAKPPGWELLCKLGSFVAKVLLDDQEAAEESKNRIGVLNSQTNVKPSHCMTSWPLGGGPDVSKD